jgi:hypothetical protein
MTDWKLDTRRFAEEVFVPVREGWDVERNLFRFFQLPLDAADDTVIDQAVRGVDAHLKRTSLAGVHKQAATSLRPAFPDHARTMRETARRHRHRDRVLADRRAFAEQVRGELRGMPALRTAQLDDYTARFRTTFIRQEIEAALRDAGIAVRDPVPLAVPPRLARWAELRLPLRELGHAGLADYLAAHRLTAHAAAADVRRVRAELDRSRSIGSLTAEETVLGMVERLVTAGTLADALRRELVDELSDAAGRGADALALALARPGTAQRAATLGLPAGDDLAYALLCRVRPAGDTDAGWREELDQALAARELRRAFEILSTRPDLPVELADQRTRLETRLEWVDAELATAAALEDTDPEAAAARYVTVLRHIQEPVAESGLRRCRPPAPPAADARVEGDRVSVVWEPAAVRAGDPEYRVVRRVDTGPAAGRSEIARTADTAAVDADAPAGTPVVYEITTVRTGTASAPATTSPVVVLRAVTELVAEPGDGEVRLHWRLPAGAVTARVHRTGGEGRVEIPGGSTTAHDATARSGAHYSYAVEAAYDSADGRVFATLAVVDAHPQSPPDSVTDLRILEESDTTALVGWTPPGHGGVVLRVTHRPPPDPGTLLPATPLLGDAVELRGREPAGVRIVLSADGRRRWVVPLTVAGELAAVGAAVEYDRRLPPVTNLQVVRQGQQLRLSWEWPAKAGAARVLVREGGSVDGPADPRATVLPISRAVFERAGCRVPARPGVPHGVAVGLTAHDGGQEVFGPLVQMSISAPPLLRYTVLPARRGHRTLVVAGEPPLPDVQLRARVTFPPLRRDEGDVLVTVHPETPDAARMSAEFTLPRGRPLHLRAFPAHPADDLELVPDDPAQLSVERRRWW